MLPSRSPSGKEVVPHAGPLDAELVLVGESPASREMEQGIPFVGRAGRMLDQLLGKTDLSRSKIRLVNAVPVRAPGDTFAKHDERDLAWGKTLLKEELSRAVAAGARLIMPLGENPLSWILPGLPWPPTWSDEDSGKTKDRTRIGVWRGSLVPYCAWSDFEGKRGKWNVCKSRAFNTIRAYEYEVREGWGKGVWALPAYHPAAIARRMNWHPDAVKDFKRAQRFLDGTLKPLPKRRWYINDMQALRRFVDVVRVERLVAFDTEQSPYWIVSLVSEEEVHTFEWSEAARGPLTAIMTDPAILKVAHNLGHDATFMRVALDITIAFPFIDTIGIAHALNSSLPRKLKPDISTRFTDWPYWGWMVDQDPKVYCGYDSIGCYDSYWPAIQQCFEAGALKDVVEHDQHLHNWLLQAQWRGVRIDDGKRLEELHRYETEHEARSKEFVVMAEPVVREKLHKFEKPHLFLKQRSCECCGGGKVARHHCWRCGLLPAQPKRLVDYCRCGIGAENLCPVRGHGEIEPLTIPQLKNALPECETCRGVGKNEQWQNINPDSDTQLKDILYRGFGIRSRRYKGGVTTRADQLAPLAEEYPIVAKTIEVSKARSNAEEMKELEPDIDGKIHSVFDPWGTVSGRTASKGGLIQKGRNLQNLPLRSRHVIVPPKGRLFVAPDEAQIEGRCIAVCSGDATLTKAYLEPLNWPGNPKHGVIDSHMRIVQLLTAKGIPLSRDQAKRTMYAWGYGVSPRQLAVELSAEAARKGEGIMVSAAMGDVIANMLSTIFPGVPGWHRQVIEALLKNRYLTSPTGRRRYWLSYITNKILYPNEGDVTLRTFERKGKTWHVVLNHKIAKEGWSYFPQDMAAWVLALGLEELQTQVPTLVWPHIHVHDELVLSIPETPGRLTDEALDAIRRLMVVEQWGMNFPVELEETPSPNWRCAKADHDHGLPTSPAPCVNCGKQPG